MVESEPNWYPRLPVKYRLYCKTNSSPNGSKKIGLMLGNFDFFAYYMFKSIEIISEY